MSIYLIGERLSHFDEQIFPMGGSKHHRGPRRVDLPHLRLKIHHLRLHEGPPEERAHFLEAKSSSKHHFSGIMLLSGE